MNITNIKQEVSFLKNRLWDLFKKNKLSYSGDWKNLIGNIPDVDNKKEHILFVSMHSGLNPNTLNIEILLMHLFRLREHHVSYLKCNKSLVACEFNIYGNGSDNFGFRYGISDRANQSKCDICNNGFNLLTSLSYLNCIELDKFAHNNSINYDNLLCEIDFENVRDFKYRNVNLGEHVYSSVCRQLLKSTFSLDNDNEKRTLFKYMLSGLKYIDKLFNLFETSKIDRIITVHGIYLVHGIVVDVAKIFDVKVVVYGAPYRKNTLMFSHNETYHKSLLTDDSKLWIDKTMLPHELLRLKEYLSQKNGGGRDYVVYNEQPINDICKIENELNTSFVGKTIYTAFTNVVWDAQLFYSSNAFKNIFLWLDCLVENFTNSPECVLLIRVHPAEFKSGFYSNESILGYLNTKFGILANNIFIIDSSSKISSYALIDISSACFVYGTKLALEIACFNKRVIIAGDAWARGKGFSIDISKPGELVTLLQNPVNIPNMSNYEHDLALKYAYYYFFGRMIDMPLINLDLSFNTNSKFLNFIEFSNFLPSNDISFDIIYDGVINGNDFSLI